MDIIKGRAVPALRRAGAKPKYPWLEMQPGDSFRFPDGVQYTSATSLASKRGYDFAMKFAIRQESDGLYCYRIDGTPASRVDGNRRQEIIRELRQPKQASAHEEVGYADDNEI